MLFALSLLLVATISPQACAPVLAVQDVPAHDPLLDLYAETYARGLLAFSAVPAAYRGGPAAPEYVQMEKRLNARRDRARTILVTRFGATAIEQIETDAEEEIGNVYFTDQAAASEQARNRYPAILRKLERSVAKLR